MIIFWVLDLKMKFLLHFRAHIRIILILELYKQQKNMKLMKLMELQFRNVQQKMFLMIPMNKMMMIKMMMYI